MSSDYTPCTVRRYSVVKIARLDYASSEFFELETNPVECQSLPQKKRNGEKGS